MYDDSKRLWLVDAEGGEAVPFAIGEDGQDLTGAAWAPDGQRLVAVTWRSDATAEYYSRLVIVDLDGNVRPITAEGPMAMEPAWSPDGSHIAYVQIIPEAGWSMHKYELWVVKADGSEARNLGRISFRQVSWLPDGRLLTYCDEDSSSLCTMNRDGSGERQVPNSSKITSFAVSREGDRVGVVAWRDGGGSTIATMRLDGSDRRVLLDQWTADGVDWSPDGRTLVFYGAPNSSPSSPCPNSTGSVYDPCPNSNSEENRMWRIDHDGSDRRALTNGAAFHPAWRPSR